MMIVMIVVVMMIIVVVMRFIPTTFDKYIAAIPFLPARFHPNGAAMGRDFPMASHPLVTSAMIGPISGNPYMIARRPIPLHNYFMTRRRRCTEIKVYID
jgi:hypothetical protein